jgi:hypothetical protein
VPIFGILLSTEWSRATMLTYKQTLKDLQAYSNEIVRLRRECDRLREQLALKVVPLRPGDSARQRYTKSGPLKSRRFIRTLAYL